MPTAVWSVPQSDFALKQVVNLKNETNQYLTEFAAKSRNLVKAASGSNL
jgi:hypothetical protein